jgi:hypothetical protein
MPAISRFFGIVVAMYYDDHAPPHFHVKYAEYRAKITIDTFEVIEGKLPRRVLGFVLEWASIFRGELGENWQRARAGLPLQPIEPLE